MNLTILIGAGLIAVSILTSLLSFRIGSPLLLVFLGIGLLAGEDGLLGISFNDASTAYFIGSIALGIILFDSGFETRLATIRSAAWPSLILATIGVLLTTALVAVAAHFLLGMNWLQSLLMGAIVSSTDAAAVFFLLRVGGVTLRERVRSTLEVESGSNDPMAIFLTVTLVELLALGAGDAPMTWNLIAAFGQQIGIGAVAGLVGGLLIVQAVNRVALEPGLYPVFVLSLALCLFAATGMLGGSGFLAVYLAGMFAGNRRLRAMNTLRRFQSGMTWLAQITMFLTLGLLARPSTFAEVALPAAVLALFLIVMGRPLAVWFCLAPSGFSRNETTFIAWVGLRGAVSILLAILPTMAGLPLSQTYFNVAFMVVLGSLIVQGWTIAPMARWLGLIVPPRRGAVERVELELPGNAPHELIAYRISEGSSVAQGERIPRWARPSLILRDGRSLRPHQAGRLQPGDYVYIFAPPRQIALLDRLFARPAPTDQQDSAFYGDFPLAPGAKLANLAGNYRFPVEPGDENATVAELLRKAFPTSVEAGDRLVYGPIELIVRSVDDDGRIEEVGMALEPTLYLQPKLPLFQNRSEIAAGFRRWRERRRKGEEKPAAAAGEKSPETQGP